MTRVCAWVEPDLWDLFEGDVELLAIADAIAATQPKQQSHLRTRRLALGVAAAAAAVTLVALFAPWQFGPGDNGIIDRALAAIGQGNVLHTVIRLEHATPGGPPPVEVEQWYDQQTREVHLILRDETGVLDDVLIRPDGTAVSQKGEVPGKPVRNRLDPALETFLTGYVPALENGTARDTGTDVVAGRAVHWIEIPIEGAHDSEQIAIDSETGEPLLVRQLSNGIEVARYRVLTLELRARQEHDFALPSSDRTGG
jgi:hypothetical protein